MTATKFIFQQLHKALNEDLGLMVDHVFRFDGDPDQAIDEYLADMSGKAGSSVMFGFTSEERRTSSASGRPSSKGIPVAIIALQRRDGVNNVTEDAERLDDLMDAVEASMEGRNPHEHYSAINVIYRSRRGLVGGPDWFGRVIEYDFITNNI
jgi:hypothetical protein